MLEAPSIILMRLKCAIRRRSVISVAGVWGKPCSEGNHVPHSDRSVCIGLQRCSSASADRHIRSFGAEKDPLSGVFLIPLGLPWNVMLTGAAEVFLPR